MRTSKRGKGRGWINYCRILGAAIVLIGAMLGAGGIWLVALGGSWYYLIAGAGLTASGALLLFVSRSGIWLYRLRFFVDASHQRDVPRTHSPVSGLRKPQLPVLLGDTFHYRACGAGDFVGPAKAALEFAQLRKEIGFECRSRADRANRRVISSASKHRIHDQHCPSVHNMRTGPAAREQPLGLIGARSSQNAKR